MKFLDIQQSAVAPRKQSIVGWYVKFDVRTLRRQKRENHTTSDVLLKCTSPRIFPFLTLWYNTNWKWVVNRYFATENMILRCLDSETTPDLLKTWKYVCEKCYLHLEPSRTITCIYYNLYDDMHTWYSRTIMNDHELSQQSTTKRCLKKDMSYAKKHANARDSGPNHHVNTRSQLSRLCQQRTEGKRKIWTSWTRLFFQIFALSQDKTEEVGAGYFTPFPPWTKPSTTEYYYKKCSD